jgi:hypothetical protein
MSHASPALITKSVDSNSRPELDGGVIRQILIVEIDAPDAETAARRIAAICPDAQVWGEVDPVDAAILVIDNCLSALAA